MSHVFKNLPSDDLFGTAPFGGGGGGGRDAAYTAGAAAVCVAGTRVSGALWSSPVKTPHIIAAATVASLTTFAACTLAGDSIPRPRD